MGPLQWTLFLPLLAVNVDAVVDKVALKEQAYDLFMHGYRSYMDHAFPADELMPLSCKGRFRGITPSRGDVDDSLGNFSLTLIDTLDTLVVVGALDEFEHAVKLVVDSVRFDGDFVVSVFETNIRILGGLLSGHLMAELVKARDPERLLWYNDRQLLKMAIDVGDRLLPAFNTTSGIPYSRINLRHGMLEYLKKQKDTCTACGGTMLLEMAALSRLSGNPVYEQKARKAMDFLWSQRHRSSDLMGTVLNVHSGDWVRRESGIGAGIDSYYEYCLKSYILLGDTSFLERFNKHYDAVMRYVNKGPLFIDVHMHRPTVATRSFMDALLAFWPGLQVLKGDVPQAIEMHEMLFQVVKKHKFLPEAFTHDFQVHWGEHPLRPEFIESTYFLYRATRDEHYLEVAQQVMDSIAKYVKVPCGFAGVKDVRTMSHEDRMDSFVLSETFKYLYMIFAEPGDLLFDPDHYVLTTEAHFLPLSMGALESSIPRRMFIHPDDATENTYISANPFPPDLEPTKPEDALRIRTRTRNVLEELLDLQGQHSKEQCARPSERLRAWAFSANNAEHIQQLKQMGIEITFQEDGRMMLTHNPVTASNTAMIKTGLEFMQEMAVYASQLEKESGAQELRNDVFVQLLSAPFFGKPAFVASPAQYGPPLVDFETEGEVAIAEPLRACAPIENANEIRGRIALIERGDCMFHQKTRFAQLAGAIGVIIIDHHEGTSTQGQPPFAMAGDKDSPDDVVIPSLFIYRVEGEQILKQLRIGRRLMARMASNPVDEDLVLRAVYSGVLARRLFLQNMHCDARLADMIVVEKSELRVTFNFHFEGVHQESEPTLHQAIVERHVNALEDILDFKSTLQRHLFFTLLRTAAYGALNLNVKDESVDVVRDALESVEIDSTRISAAHGFFRGELTQVRCKPKAERMECVRIPL